MGPCQDFGFKEWRQSQLRQRNLREKQDPAMVAEAWTPSVSEFTPAAPRWRLADATRNLLATMPGMPGGVSRSWGRQGICIACI